MVCLYVRVRPVLALGGESNCKLQIFVEREILRTGLSYQLLLWQHFVLQVLSKSKQSAVKAKTNLQYIV